MEGYVINVKKIKVMHVKNTPEDINVNGLGSKPLEHITDFTYIRSTLAVMQSFQSLQ